ncbi:MAG TPA: SCO1664 family protein [Herpetosiphonaceae bacterium]
MDDQPSERTDEPRSSAAVPVERVIALLTHGTMEIEGLMPDSSNYTFLASIADDDLQGLAIYKPRRGERPLWDFPRGTLCQREAAAYLVSEALGWAIVPPTVLRDAPEYGVGSVQLFIDADPEVHYFTLRGSDHDAFKRIAAFDLIVNNADRKGGHILQDRDGHLWGIDHGITFHTDPKLRTVIWEYAGQPIPEPLISDIQRLAQRVETPNDDLTAALDALLARVELDALRRRVERVLRRAQYPEPTGGRSMPWPPI